MAGGFCTVGHSNRSLADFVEILRAAGVQVVADVRSFPRSRRNPAFNIDSLPDELERHQIGYRHFPDLGGRRKIQPQVPDRRNAFWHNRSFRNYADYALSDQFAQAYSELVELGRHRRVALMCSEAVWWRCHRRIIADYLLLDGKQVAHLMDNGREDAARPTPGAERTADGKVVYPEAAEPQP
ncbi:MAG: DUF488 domain-containing protein [Rhodobacteraceae bacterium]|nr:MAG: DUF488 domain-containing protein [Paracoccaceae bacterium]